MASPEAATAEKARAPAHAEGPQTSVDRYEPSEATVRFRRWFAFGNTAYLRGQEAGFSMAEATVLARRGVADIVHARELNRSMVTK